MIYILTIAIIYSIYLGYKATKINKHDNSKDNN